MSQTREELLGRLRPFKQEHLLQWWDELEDLSRQQLADQIRSIDFKSVLGLFHQRQQKFELPARESIAPLPRPGEMGSGKHIAIGEQALRSGEVAFLVVAGGQGSRLGFEHPKGMFPIGPVSKKSLFQIHFEKALAMQRRFGAQFPFLVMTSPATHDETVAFFKDHDHFGYPPNLVHFFCQATMPALDIETGKLLMQEKHSLFLSPNGHGGTLTGLADSGLLESLSQRGIRTIYYFQVDNPLVRLLDVPFLGQHLHQRAEISSKVIEKETPTDKLGNIVLVDGRCTIIEYSDLPADLGAETDEAGQLKIWAGNAAIHLFDVDFLRRVTAQDTALPWHIAHKKVPCLDSHGNLLEPASENALKFERFIFDVLPLAERWTVVPITRRLEFEPLKNATGKESPDSVQRAISTQAADWLRQAGVDVPCDDTGRPCVPLEISPLFALDTEELAGKIKPGLQIRQPTIFE